MTRLNRIARLIRYFSRIRDKKAGELAGVEARMIGLKREIAAKQTRWRGVNEFLGVGGDGTVDVQMIKIAAEYKKFLKAEIEACLRQLQTVEVEVASKRSETTEAHRTVKIWENLKEKQIAAEEEDAGQRAQRELDELAQQKKHHFRDGRVCGTNNQTNR